jgi:PAS domain S-box-containing protein
MRFLAVNEAAVRHYGYSREEFLDMTLKDIRSPESNPFLFEYEPTLAPGRNKPAQGRHRKKDGTSIDVEVSLEPIPWKGRQAWLVAANDVTERKRAEQALAAERNLFQILMDHSLDTIYFKDSACRFTRINKAQAEVLGLRDPEAVVGKTDFDFFSPEVAREFYAEDQKIIQTGQPLVGKIEHFHAPGGNEAWFLCTETPVKNKDGQVTGIVGISRDITELKRAEEWLRQLSGRLLRSQDEERRRIARELHDSTAQNLAALVMELGRLEKSLANVDPHIRNTVADGIALAEQCSREIRTLSYLLHPPMLDALGLASAVRWYLDGYAKRSGLQVDLDVGPNLGRLQQEVETALFRVVQESLSNIHHHSGSPSARIRLVQREAEVRLEISDEGRGMPPASPSKATGTMAGLGVGIASMRERISELGGRLEIYSSPRGTTVKAVVPITVRTE